MHLDRFAAIKLLYTQVDGPDVQRFKREARIVADLRHPHIVNILDFGVQDGRVPYLIMQYAPRGTLRGLYPRGSVLPPAEVLAYVTQVAQALDFAHSRHVIHRDVKPENMLLAEDDTLLLSDFGIATLFSESGRQVTPHVAGTSAYMAPEQLRGKPHPASDQYALGVVAYEWLCGERPFRGSFPEIAAQHLNASPPALRSRNPRISPALEEVVHVALAKHPEQRYPSVGDFAADFRAALQSSVQYPAPPLPTRSTRRSLDTILVQPSSMPLSGTRLPSARPRSARDEQFAATRKRHISRRALLLSLGGVLTLAGTGGTLAWLSTHHPTPTPTSSTHPPAGASRSVAKKAGSATSDPTPTTIPILTTLQIYSGHTDIVHAVAWSPDGNNIVSGSRDGTAQLWNASTAQTIFIYKKHNDIVDAVAWSSDAKFIASGSYDQTVQVWDSTKGARASEFNGLNRIISSVSWSPVASRLAASGLDSDEVQILDPGTGISAGLPYHLHSNFVYAVAWSPDGTRIATAGGGGTGSSVQVWDVTKNSIVASFNGHTGGVFAVTWSPDGQFIASGGGDKTVRIWSIATQQEVRVYQEHEGAVNTVAWCPKNPGILASGGQDKTVKIWTNFGITLHTYDKHLDYVRSITWSPDGTRIASASADKTVRVWQAT